MRAPKRSLHCIFIGFNMCKVVCRVTYYWKLQHFLRRIPLLIPIYRTVNFMLSPNIRSDNV